MHHFYGNPLSIFLPLLELEESQIETQLSKWLEEDLVNEHHIAHIRMLQSFRTYIESLVTSEPKKALRLLEDDNYLMTEVVPSLMSDIKIYQEQFKMGINLVVLLKSQFPSFTSFASLRKHKRMILLEALEAQQSFAEKGDLVKTIIILIRKIDEEHIGKLLKELRQFFKGDDYKNVNQNALDQLKEWEKRYEQLGEADADHNAKMDRKAKLLEGLILPNADAAHGRRTGTAIRVQTQSIEHIKRKGTEASKLAMDIADWFDKTLT